MYRFLYTLLLLAVLPPLFLVRMLWPKKGKPRYGRRWVELLGLGGKSRGGGIWFHAVSVGEVVAATPIIHRLRGLYPDRPIVLTTTTTTGARIARKLLDEPWICHRFAPLDLPWTVAAFLRRHRPTALLLMETELWPNQLAACGRRRMPVVLLNARLSERSYRRYHYIPGLFRRLSRHLTLLLCQHRDDAERFARLAVGHERLQVTGSVKFDITYDDSVRCHGEALREQLGVDRPVWIAASTHAGEDEQVLDAFAEVRKRHPQALLLLVPRHPQRFDDVATLCRQRGLAMVRRTETLPVTAKTQVYLGDTMGELPLMFAAADVAFVGGSLVPVGGHNLLEPAALGRAALTGPHFFNFNNITAQLCERGAVKVVESAAELADVVNGLLADPQARQAMGAAGQQVVQSNRGALDRTMQALAVLL